MTDCLALPVLGADLVAQAQLVRQVSLGLLATAATLQSARWCRDSHDGLALGGLAKGQEEMLVVGHRGASSSAPENTLASLARAVLQGAQGVEFDIQRSQEGELFLLHDDTLRRTACARCPEELRNHGELSQEEYDQMLDRDVSTLSYWDFIRHVDVGSWKDTVFSGQRPCLFSEAMEQLPTGHFALCEIKSGDVATANDIAALVQEQGWRGDRLVLIGFDLEVMAEVKHQLVAQGCGDVPVISVLEAPSAEAAKQHVDVAKKAGLDGVDFQADPSIVTPAVIEAAASQDMHIGVWVWKERLPQGGDTAENITTFRDRGITFFTSDLPAEVCEWMTMRVEAGFVVRSFGRG